MTSKSKVGLAILYANSKSYDRAIKILEDTFSLTGTRSLDEGLHASELRLLAKCYERKGDSTQAKGLYLRALATASKCRPVILSSLANLYKTLGNYKEAETFIE